MAVWEREGLYISGLGEALPDAESVASAVHDLRYPAVLARRTQQLAVTVAPLDTPPIVFATDAARQALAASGYKPEQVGFMAHGVALNAGPMCWNSTAFIARELGIGGFVEVAEVRNGCDGPFTGLRLAAAHLKAHRECPAAVISAADCWQPPDIDRWTAVPDLPYGDGGAALVLSRESGLVQLLATAVYVDATLEPWHRGNELCGHRITSPVSLRERAHYYYETEDENGAWERAGVATRAVIDRVLVETGIASHQVARVIMPFNGKQILDDWYRRQIAIPMGEAGYQRGRTIGHMGGADQIIALRAMLDSGELIPGDLAVIYGEGVGLVESATLIRVV